MAYTTKPMGWGSIASLAQGAKNNYSGGEYNIRKDRLPRSRGDLPNGYESNDYKVRALRNAIANAQKACYAFHCIMKCFRKHASHAARHENQKWQVEEITFSSAVH